MGNETKRIGITFGEMYLFLLGMLVLASSFMMLAIALIITEVI